MINIYVDADACPVKEIIIKVAKEFNLKVFMFIDTSHILSNDYAEIITVDKANDSVDFAIANRIKKDDIAVTQDYGLASLLLAKDVCVLNQNGFIYTTNNIDKLLFERHILKKARRAKLAMHSHIKKRMKEDDLKFEKSFRQTCLKMLQL